MQASINRVDEIHLMFSSFAHKKIRKKKLRKRNIQYTLEQILMHSLLKVVGIKDIARILHKYIIHLSLNGT